ncbi:MAG: alpha/beta hydrolase [Myxococcota bacterium]
MQTSIQRIVLIPRRGATAADAFYPWLRSQISIPMIVPDMLRPQQPRVREWTPLVLAQVWVNPEQTLLVGHGLGALAAVRAAAQLPEGARLGGLLGVGGWWTTTSRWAGSAAWLKDDVDLNRARKAAQDRCRVLLSDDDPIPGEPDANPGRWARRMGAQVKTVSGAGRFDQAEAPDVLKAILEMI